MLGKLIKYEFRATGRIMLPLMAAIVVLSVMAGLSERVVDLPHMPGFANALAITVIVLFFLGLFAIFVVAVVQMIERFYRNLLSDEGYLMFTLPTSPDALICSKLIVSFVWFTAAGILCGLGVVLMMASSSLTVDWSFLGDLRAAIDEGLKIIGNGSTAAGAGNIAGWAVELLVLWFLGTAGFCLRFYAAMAIGFSFDEHKKLLSVVFFFLIGIALNTIGTAIFSPIAGSGVMEKFLFPEVFSAGRVHAILLISAAVGLLTDGIYYLATSLLLRKKLNLP